MLNIEYINEYLEGEPPPNFYWYGGMNDFLKLSNDLQVLENSNDISLILNNLEYINTNGLEIHLRAKKDAKILNKKIENKIIIELDKNIWKSILEIFKILAVNSVHDYIDLEKYEVMEEANFIVSSEIDTTQFRE